MQRHLNGDGCFVLWLGCRRSSSVWLRWRRARSRRGSSWVPWLAVSGHDPSSSDGPRCCHRVTRTLSSRLLHAWTLLVVLALCLSYISFLFCYFGRFGSARVNKGLHGAMGILLLLL